MSGSKVLIDSNIIIYLSKGVLEIEEITNHYDELCISIITYMEVLGFQFSDQEELETTKNLLNHFKIIYINREIADNVISIRQKKAIKLPDAIILATAILLEGDLCTRNESDFLNISENIKIVNPFKQPA